MIHSNKQLSEGRLIHGDCTKILERFPRESVHLVLTDPPYLARYRSRDGRVVPNDDNDRWLKPAFLQLFRVLRNNSFAISFYGWHQVDRFVHSWRAAGFGLAGHFVFPKRYASSERFVRYQHEQAYLLIKGIPPQPQKPIPDVLNWQYTHNTLHPTQKPILILETLIASFSRPGEIVLDPFCGSGSTLIAARRLERRFVGIELNAEYFRIAKERLSAFG